MGIPRGVLAAALVVSCGSPQHGGKPAEPAPKVVTYAPLGIKADAKAPQQAVILGTDDKNGSTVISLPALPGKAAVDAMVVTKSPPITGGLTPVELATAPNPQGSVQVGIDDKGPRWRAGVWTSALVAAVTLDKDVTDFTWSASSGGTTDGTSALIAGGFLAAITGAPIDPTATLAGTINPDGTIGPASGIPDTFLAAIAKGKKRLGYPAGMRMAKSAATGELVDVVALASQHGVQAVEIGDVHDAYKLLTGKSLPAPLPVADSEMALDQATTAALEVRYKESQARVGTDWATLVQLESAGRLPAVLVAMRTYAKNYAEAAEALHKRGLVGAAYSRMLAAWAFGSATTQAYDVLQKVQSGNLAAALDAIKALDRLDDTTALLEKIGALRPSTLGGHLEMMAAFQAALRGYVFEQMASQSIAQSAAYLQSLQGVPTAQLGAPETADKVMEAVAPPLLYIARTIAESTLATQELELETEHGVPYTCATPNVYRISTAFQSASTAGLAYVDTLLTEPLAQELKISEDEARNRVSQLEPDYYVASVTSRLGTGPLDKLETTWGEQSLAWVLLSLAGSELAYDDAAGLIAKYDSLEVHSDDSGKLTKVEHDKALTSMLAAAERSARASAHEAKIAAGAIPVQAKLAYQLAQVERDGDLGDKLDALSEYWAATAFSQTAVMFARN